MTQPRTLGEIVRAVAPPPVVFTVGTVAAVDEATLSVDVKPDDGGETIKNVPLRVMRYQNRAGVAVVPKLGTEAVVAWLDPNRPTVIAVQEWEKIIALTAAGFGIVISDIIALGDQNKAVHPVAWGDTVATYLNKIWLFLAYHKHKDVMAGVDESGAATTWPPAVPGDLISADVYTS